MLKPEDVPDEVVSAYMHAIVCGGIDGAEAIAAAINAWPGAEPLRRRYVGGKGIFLPPPPEGVK